MDFKKYNNLIDLFFEQTEKQPKEKIFLSNLKDSKKIFTWGDVKHSVLQLGNQISKIIQKGDRCLLISENRPEWMISDLSIMLAGGITVPAYTTYVARDYEYIINDCTPRTRPRLAPDKPDNFFASPKHIAEEVFKVVKQDRSTWSFRVELRPYGEYW